jgi:Chaperone of endosialidase
MISNKQQQSGIQPQQKTNTKNMTTSQLRNSVNRSPLRLVFLPILMACFTLSPRAQAVGPDTDGSIAGSNNGEGIGVLVSRTTGIWNTGTGFEALNHLTAGNQNTATGLRALFSDTSGGFNTATGVYALFGNTSGFFNSGIGAYSLAHNTTGDSNTANGYGALYFNTEGEQNTAIGSAALYKSTTSSRNTAVGYQSLFSNTAGSYNMAVGYQALLSNTIGDFNAAVGHSALRGNQIGIQNTATGYAALLTNTTGTANTANGERALVNNVTGHGNTATGSGALFLNTSGDGNIALGVAAGQNLTTGDHNIDIGNSGVAGESNTIRIGDAFHTRAFIAGIRGRTTGNNNAVPVLIDSVGQLGTASSSRRFKKEIKPMDKASEAILGLKPVVFHYKSDGTATPQFGLIAEEVAEVNPHLVVRDDNGEIYTVRYEAVNAMLLNEFLKEHRKNEEQEATINKLQKQIEALAAGLQKISVQVEMSRPSPQTVLNNQ